MAELVRHLRLMLDANYVRSRHRRISLIGDDYDKATLPSVLLLRLVTGIDGQMTTDLAQSLSTTVRFPQCASDPTS